MGNYATTTSLAIRMINVSFDTATTALATEMINDAEAEINKWLSRRYDIGSAYFQTTTSIPPVVRMLCMRLSEGYMWKAMSRGGKESLERGDGMIKPVMDNLKAIAEYEAELLDTAGSLIVDMSNTSCRVLSNTKDYSNTFNEDPALNWNISGTKLDDIADERD